MAALRAAKQALRKEIKRRVAVLSDSEKQRQSLVVSHKVRTWTESTTADEALLAGFKFYYCLFTAKLRVGRVLNPCIRWNWNPNVNGCSTKKRFCFAASSFIWKQLLVVID